MSLKTVQKKPRREKYLKGPKYHRPRKFQQGAQA